MWYAFHSQTANQSAQAFSGRYRNCGSRCRRPEKDARFLTRFPANAGEGR
jgi:hypothetical protein